MNTEQMRAEFEEWCPVLRDTAYNPALGYYLSTTEVSTYYEQTIREHNCKWQAWQACCKKQEDRMAKLEQRICRLTERNEIRSNREEKCIAACEGITFSDDRDFTGQMVTDIYRIAELERQVSELEANLAHADNYKTEREFVVELPKAELIGSYLDHPANTRINVYKLPVLETIAAIEAAGGRVKDRT